MPSVGFTGVTSGEYASKHAPWVNWQGTGHNQLAPKDSQPFSAFPTNFKKLPTVSLVIPDLLDDMHDGTVAQADTWLKQNMNAYIQWAKSHNSLFILTTDEDDDLHNNQITTLFVGGGVKSGQYSEHITHLNVLRTIEAMYHLPAVGGSASVVADQGRLDGAPLRRPARGNSPGNTGSAETDDTSPKRPLVNGSSPPEFTRWRVGLMEAFFILARSASE